MTLNRRRGGGRRTSDTNVGVVGTELLITSIFSPNLTVGQTYQATAQARNSRTGSEDAVMTAAITWASGDTNVFTVNGSGLVSYVGGGSASLTASVAGLTASQTIVCETPPPSVASVEVLPATLDLIVGGGGSPITALVKDGSGNILSGQTVTWQSSQTSKATVSADSGDPTHQTTCSPVASGSSTVTATCGAQSDTCAVTVAAAPGGAAPIYSNDFSQYADTAALIADAANRNNPQAGKKFILSEDKNPSWISLQSGTNPVTGQPGYMRYTWQTSKCGDQSVARAVFFPGALAYQELWVEIKEAFSTSPPFDTLASDLVGCGAGADYKHVVWFVQGPADGRLGFSDQGNSHSAKIEFTVGGSPGGATNQQFHSSAIPWATRADGNLHTYRFHTKVNGSSTPGGNAGILAMSFDGTLIHNHLNVDIPRTSIYAVGSANVNKTGVANAGMYRNIYQIQVYDQDPGWGF